MEHRVRKLGLLVSLALMASASPAAAAVTIGQTGTPTAPCAAGVDRLQPTVISGTSYVVPSTVAEGTIVSWSTEAFTGAGQNLALKLYRPITGVFYRVVAHEGPHPLNAGVVNTFTASVPVKAGDILGNSVPVGATNTGCNFPVTGENYLTHTGNLVDGDFGDFTTGTPDRRQNISAVIEPTNTFTQGLTTRNKKQGNATVAFNVPNPGTLTATGTGVSAASAGAQTSATATGPGQVSLLINATGKKKKKLRSKGKVTLSSTVTYTPTGGTAKSLATSVKLKLKKKK
jgi:hypothetical protein